ncbi:MAG TPA: hypothetical protein DCK85_14730 [Ktedonobacter sp.]|nr:hypothetical protein [Ktedonobacter sp.]
MPKRRSYNTLSTINQTRNTFDKSQTLADSRHLINHLKVISGSQELSSGRWHSVCRTMRCADIGNGLWDTDNYLCLMNQRQNKGDQLFAQRYS